MHTRPYTQKSKDTENCMASVTPSSFSTAGIPDAKCNTGLSTWPNCSPMEDCAGIYPVSGTLRCIDLCH